MFWQLEHSIGSNSLIIKNRGRFGKVISLIAVLNLIPSYGFAGNFSTASKSSGSKSAPKFNFPANSHTKSKSFSTNNNNSSFKFGKTDRSSVEQQYNDQVAKKSYQFFRRNNQNDKPFRFPDSDIKNYRNRYSNNGLFRRAGKEGNSWDSRDRYYQAHPPVIIDGGSRSFGMLSGMFLYGLLDNVASAAEYAFHHQRDEDYLKWRAEADRLARNNAELKAQLNRLDQEKPSKNNGQPNPEWLPEGVPAAAALSDVALKSSQPDFNVCVGSEVGPYYKVTQNNILPAVADWINLNPVITSGTPEILNRLATGACDAGFIQGDAEFDKDKLEVIFKPFLEAGHLACSSKLKGSSISDVADQSVWIPMNSGSRVTWNHLVQLNPDYQKMAIKDAVNYEDAILKAVQSKSCLFYMAAPHASSIDRLIDRKDLKLMVIDDERLSKDSKYQIRSLSSEDYERSIQHHFFSNGYVKTIVTPATFIMSREWKANHAELAAKISLKLSDIQQQLKHAVKQ